MNESNSSIDLVPNGNNDYISPKTIEVTDEIAMPPESENISSGEILADLIE